MCGPVKQIGRAGLGSLGSAVLWCTGLGRCNAEEPTRQPNYLATVTCRKNSTASHDPGEPGACPARQAMSGQYIVGVLFAMYLKNGMQVTGGTGSLWPTRQSRPRWIACVPFFYIVRLRHLCRGVENPAKKSRKEKLGKLGNEESH